MFKLWPFRNALTWVLFFLFIGPVFILLALVFGANILDGLFGVYENTPLQASLVTIGSLGLLGIPLAAALSLLAVYRHGKKDTKYTQVLLPIGLVLGVLLLPSILSYVVSLVTNVT